MAWANSSLPHPVSAQNGFILEVVGAYQQAVDIPHQSLPVNDQHPHEGVVPDGTESRGENGFHIQFRQLREI
jgi:hypothetical protein